MEASNLSISVGVPDANRPKSRIARLLTLERVIEWIESQGFDEYTTKGLIDLASRYPSHALPSFKRNFTVMLQRVRAKRKMESTETHEEQVPLVNDLSSDDVLDEDNNSESLSI